MDEARNVAVCCKDGNDSSCSIKWMEFLNVAVCCKDGNDSSCSIKWMEFLNQLKHC